MAILNCGFISSANQIMLVFVIKVVLLVQAPIGGCGEAAHKTLTAIIGSRGPASQKGTLTDPLYIIYWVPLYV